MRTVLVTGATSGFGKLIAQAFLNHGDIVIATGRNLKERKDIFNSERTLFQEKLVEFSMDVTNVNEVKEVEKEVLNRFGKIDILINNAGYGLFGALEDLRDEEIRYQMEVNFFGTVNVTKIFLPLLRKSKGKIFNFSSVFGFMGFPMTSLYCASKFAVEGLTESLRGELAPHGVQLCLIEPGGYRTNFGTSLNWSTKEESTYTVQFKNYKNLHQKILTRKPQIPSEVSDGILKLSLKKNLPMRKVFGKDATFSHLLKNFLPGCIYFGLMDMVYKKIFMRESN
jgi:NAD(P)-dependent dehydrogenase (short-subunit alcohol dehydrogenase family)